MKHFAERCPKGRPHRGFLAACSSCGLVVVHASSTGQPFHMHRRSRKCEELSQRRRGFTLSPKR